MVANFDGAPYRELPPASGSLKMDLIFAKAKIRYVIPTIVVGSILPYFAAGFITSIDIETLDASLNSVALGIASYVLIFALLWIWWCSKSGVATVFGQMPHTAASKTLLGLGIPMVGTAMFCYYILFFPLSYVAPDFVRWWAVESPELFVPTNRPDALGINLGTAILLILVAPVVEEMIFRGFLLGRLSAKVGTGTSIVITSILFALLHSDVLGALLFAIVLCLIRIKYNSLLAPILVHIGNNAFVALLVGIDLFIFGAEYEFTLQEFRAYWWLAPIGAVIGFPWLYRFYQKELIHVRWKSTAA